jgi:hypothetical protein
MLRLQVERLPQTEGDEIAHKGHDVGSARSGWDRILFYYSQTLARD